MSNIRESKIKFFFIKISKHIFLIFYECWARISRERTHSTRTGRKKARATQNMKLVRINLKREFGTARRTAGTVAVGL